MNLYPGASPAFLTKNYLNRHANNASDLLVSSGDTTKHRLFDMDPRSRWQSQGSSDAVTETIEFGLWVPGASMSHDVHYIFVMNHNIGTLSIEHSNTGAAPWTLAYSQSGLTEKNTRLVLVETAMDRIKISMGATQVADAEKAVGDILVMGESFQPGPLFEYKREAPKIQQKTAKMADGSLRGQLIGRSDASFHFYAAKCAFIMDPENYDSTTTAFEDAMEQMRAFGLRGEQFVFMPEPGDKPDEAYLCRVRPMSYNENYVTLSKSGDLLGVQMVIEEIGGA